MIVMVWDKFLTKINFQECKNIIAFITIQAPAISFFFFIEEFANKSQKHFLIRISKDTASNFYIARVPMNNMI